MKKLLPGSSNIYRWYSSDLSTKKTVLSYGIQNDELQIELMLQRWYPKVESGTKTPGNWGQDSSR